MRPTMSYSPASRNEARPVNWGRFVFVALGTIIAALLANVLVYIIGSAVIGYDPQFVVLKDVSATILFTVVPAIVATLLYAVLLRFAADPARIFSIVAALVLIISLIPDFTYIPTVPGATAGQTAILAVMHVIAAVVIVSMLTRFSSPPSRRS